MLISELVERTGLSKHTLRYYEKEGLLDGTIERLDNNYRVYSEETVERITLVKHGQLVGFTIREIRTLLFSWMAGELSVEEQIVIFKDKVTDIDRQMADLVKMKEYLLLKINILEEEGELPMPDKAAKV